MNKLLLSASFVISALLSSAQISITASSMPVSGDTIRYSNATLASVGDYTSTGANYTWNFSTLVPTSQAIRAFKPGTATPYFILFGFTAYGELVQDTVPIPTIPITGVPSIKITDVYNFYSKSSTKFITEGLGVKINGIPVPSLFDSGKEDVLYKIPLNYTDRDSTIFKFSTPTTTAIPFQYSKEGYRITEADGYGSITTPQGTYNCLRVITTQYSMDTIRGTITLPVVGPTPFKFGFPNYQRSYQWLTTTEHIPVLEISGTYNNNTFVANQAKYRQTIVSFVGLVENEKNNLNISVFPNPSSSILNIKLPTNTNKLNATIINAQGQLIKCLDINGSQTIDVSFLPAGIYFIDLKNEKGTQKLKILIQ